METAEQQSTGTSNAQPADEPDTKVGKPPSLVDFDAELLKMADRCFAHALDQFAKSTGYCTPHEELRRLGMAHRLADLARRIGVERDRQERGR